MGRERGASVIGVVVVLMVLGALAGLAVAAFPRDPSGTSSRLEGLTPELQPGVGAAPSTQAARPPSPADGATAGACATSARTVQAAAAAKQAADGTYPSNVTELVTGGWLSEAPRIRGYELTLEVVGGLPTGKVLVNGLASELGCSVPPKAGP